MRNDVGLDDQEIQLRNWAKRLFVYFSIIQSIDESVVGALRDYLGEVESRLVRCAVVIAT